MTYITNGVTLELPGMKGEGHTMLVLEKDYIELSNYLGTQVHGVFGYEIFSRFIVKIDFSKQILSLIKPEKFKKRKKRFPLNPTNWCIPLPRSPALARCVLEH